MKRFITFVLAATFSHSVFATDVKDHPKFDDIVGYWCGPNSVGLNFFSQYRVVFKNGDKVNQFHFDNVAVTGSTIRLTYTDIVVSGNSAERKAFYLDYEVSQNNDVLIEKNSNTEYHRCERDKVIYKTAPSIDPNDPLEKIRQRMIEHSNKQESK